MKIFSGGTHKPDYLVLGIFSLLIAFGLLMLSSASSHLGEAGFGDPYFYLKHQIYFGLIPGLIAFLIASKVNYSLYKSRFLSVGLLLFSIVLIGLVFTPLGFSAKGASRWLSVGGFTFQPAEFLKITLIVYLAAWLKRKQERKNSIGSGLLPFLVILGIISGLLILQHSTSPVAILLSVALIIYFMSGARWRYIFSMVFLSVIALSAIIAITPYRIQRILTFLNPEQDPTNTGFHLLQAKTAIGSGGIIGVGYGQSTIKFNLPEPIGDSIFAILAEEFGFIGAALAVLLFLFLVLRIFLISKNIQDNFGKLLLIGFGSLIAIQAFVNIGAMSGLLPVTGTPLPFISYGGTNLVVFMTIMGIISNISSTARRSYSR